MKVIFGILTCIALSSCARHIVATTEVKHDSIIVMERTTTRVDTMWRLRPADSTYIKAYVECDSNYHAHLRMVTATSKRADVSAVINANILTATARCREDSLMNLLTTVRTDFSQYKMHSESMQKTVMVKNPVNGYLLLWFIASLLAIAYGIYSKFKNLLNIKSWLN